MSSKAKSDDTARPETAAGASPLPGPEQAAGQVAAVRGDGQGQPEGRPGRAVMVHREGRGRLGGTTVLLSIIQRAFSQGRQVKVLEGDLKSRTLARYYPSHTPEGMPIEGGASMPRSEDFADFKVWINGGLDAMVVDGISRVLDVSGGDRAMREFLHDLDLPAFCAQFDKELLSACMLGPDVEDFNHIRAAVDAGNLHPRHMILVLNEGVIRSGQNPAGAFDATKQHPDFLAMVKGGAVPIYVTKLPCLDLLREQRLDFYDVAAGRPGPDGTRPRPTTQFMTGKWLADFEAQHVRWGTAGRLP